MAELFNTKDLTESYMKTLDPDRSSWIYNGLDCCVTADIYNVLITELETEPENVRATYLFALDKLAPIMEMSMRGTRIHAGKLREALTELEQIRRDVDARFQQLVYGVFDCGCNPNSPTQVKNLLYGMLGLKEIKKRNSKGFFAAAADAEALERLMVYPHARVFCKFILILRDLQKQMGFLKTEIDPDGRMRTSYNITGTNTGRLSSKMSEFGTGTNLQNVNRKLRFPFVADKGKRLVNVDLEQADARNLGAVCWNRFFHTHGPAFAGAFLDAAESGDLHTVVAKMTWSELAWPTSEQEWKQFCDNLILHGQDSYRQAAKKLGHGTNYYGKPATMAKHTHTPVKIITDFQNRYFNNFPCIPEYHKAVIHDIKTAGVITNLFGRRRHFFGRGDDAGTHRAAIAYSPQSSTGEQIDRGLHQVWTAFPEVELLNQVHDSILFQVDDNIADEITPDILSTMRVPIILEGGREFAVPLDAKTGWNWGDFNTDNPYGLKKWKGKETRNAPVYQHRLKDFL